MTPYDSELFHRILEQPFWDTRTLKLLIKYHNRPENTYVFYNL